MTDSIAPTDEKPATNGSHVYPNGRWHAPGSARQGPALPQPLLNRAPPESGRADLLVGLDAQQRIPTAVRGFDARNFATEKPLPDDQPADAHRIAEAALAILDQGEALLHALSVESYTRRVPLAFNASIGGHYRHCLDHFSSLLRGLDADVVDYDHRERDARIESQPDYALALTRQIRSQLEQLPPGTLCAPVQARCEVSYAHGDSPVTGSTIGREMVYAIAHAIHHYALISVMARLMDAKLPEHFGVAPSTVAHLKATGQK